jgi:hypothetical protein
MAIQAADEQRLWHSRDPWHNRVLGRLCGATLLWFGPPADALRRL